MLIVLYFIQTSSDDSQLRALNEDEVAAVKEKEREETEESQPKVKRRRVRKLLAEGSISAVDELRERERSFDLTARLKFAENGDLANLANLNSTLRKCISIASNFYIAVVVYTLETPFPETTGDGGEAAGEILGGVALGLAAKTNNKYQHIAARIQSGDEVLLATVGKYVRLYLPRLPSQQMPHREGYRYGR